MKRMNQKFLHEAVERNIMQDIARGNIAGAAALVLQDGEIICDLRVGYKNIKTKEMLKKHHIFRLASLTKPVTAVACLIGVQNGWFSLNDRVADYFPKVINMYVGKEEHGNVVPCHRHKNDMLIYHLLSHSSGIMASNDIGTLQEEQMPLSAYASCRAMVDYCIENTCLSFEPGMAEAYSAYAAFDFIACLIEEKSGMPFDEFVKKHIFEPIGISDITFHPTEEQWSKVVTMYDKAAGGDMLEIDMGRHTFESFPLRYTCAGASLVGSIEDYMIFAEMIRCGGAYGGVRILDENVAMLMGKPYVPAHIMREEMQHRWGLGVRVTENHDTLPDGCFGWSGAYGTHFWIDRENKVTAIYMKNTRWHDSHGGGNTALAFERAVMSSLEKIK